MLLISSINENVRRELLNPKFPCRKSSRRYRHRKECLFQEPLLLFQALLQGQETFEILLEAGACLMLTDQQGFNVCHFLVVVSYVILGMEDKCISIYNDLKTSLFHRDLKTLLQMEDHEGLRPLELAVHLGCIQIFHAVFNTHGLYLLKSGPHGFYYIKEYDITEHEAVNWGNRRNKSPLSLLTTVDGRILADDIALRSITTGPIGHWTSRKMKCNAPFILMWAFLPLLSIATFYLLVGFDANVLHNLVSAYVNRFNITLINERDANMTDLFCNVTDWYGVYANPNIIMFSIIYFWIFFPISVFWEMAEGFITLIFHLNKWKKCFGESKNLLASTVHYRMCQFLFCFVGVIWITIYTAYFPNRYLEMGVIVMAYVSTWSMLYFAQLFPYIGYFVNTIQRMLTIMFQFILVYLMIFLPFPHAFQILLRSNSCDAVPGFQSFAQAAYSVFRIMLNMEDLTWYDTKPSSAAFTLHIIFVFMVAILLINFLVSLMSNSVDEVEANEAIMLIQRLSVVTLIEWRLLYPFAFIYRRLHKLVYKCYDGKIILKHNELIKHI